MKILLTIFFIVYTHLLLDAQQRQLSGTLKTHAGKPAAHATVMLKNTNGRIISFTSSNQEGKYTIGVPDTARVTLLYLEVSGLSYKTRQQSLQEGRFAYDFILEEKVLELPEVKITNKPVIVSKGDTLSYDVSSFARDEDRSIGDVIRRLPGITVAENGQIYYNGKPVFNLYIHGDDLMDGRYTLATKTISKEMIKSVDVIQNFQPIKVLRNKVLTDNVLLNLVLKDENSLKLSGQAMLGAGVPEQFDAALNLMLFNKRFKMLNSFKANNLGTDYQDDLNQFGSSGFLGSIGNTRPNDLVFAGTAGNPDLPRNNYYLNRSGIANINHLFNTGKGLQLRANLQAFVDRNTFNYSSTVENYVSGDTIRYSEQQNALRKPYQFNTSVTAMLNKEKYFLNNTLRFNLSGETNENYMDFNGDAFGQQFRKRTYDFSNDLNWTPALKNKGIMELRWYINHYNNPQHLYIGSGLNPDILNEGIAYAAIDQQAETPALFSHASVSYRLSHQLIRQSYQVGLLNERQQLNSTLNLLQQDGDYKPYAGDQGNALHWKRDRFYINSSYDIRKKSWEASLSVPVIWQSIKYDQVEYALNKRQNQFFVNPAASLKLFVYAEDYISLKYSYSNNVGNISGIYRGTILTNYRSLFANDAALQENNNSSTGVSYNFQRSIIMLFINAGVTYNNIRANSILSSVLTNNVQRTILLPYENDQSSLIATAGISKFLFGLRTTASLKGIFRKERYDQFINSERLPFINNTFTLSAGIESKLFGNITFSYNSTGALNTSRNIEKNPGAPKLENKVQRLDQNIGLGYSPVKSLFFNVRGRHIYSTQANVADINYLFLNTNIRYKLIRWKTDIELDVTNITNIRNYELFILSSSRFAVNRYEIRGRMAVLRATFNL
jgi:hypothetical protein